MTFITDSLWEKPRYAVGLTLAALVIAFVVLVPFTYTDTIGWNVALTGVTPNSSPAPAMLSAAVAAAGYRTPVPSTGVTTDGEEYIILTADRKIVAEEVKSGRLQRLFARTDAISRELNEGLVGRTVQVLIDGTSRRDPEHWQGRGEDNRVVNFPKSGREEIGDVVNVEVTRAGPHSLAGEIVGGVVRLPVFTTGPGTHERPI